MIFAGKESELATKQMSSTLQNFNWLTKLKWFELRPTFLTKRGATDFTLNNALENLA